MRCLYIDGVIMPCAAGELSVLYEDVNFVDVMSDGSVDVRSGNGGGKLTVRFLLPYEKSKCEIYSEEYRADHVADTLRRRIRGGSMEVVETVDEEGSGVELSRHCVSAVVTEAKFSYGDDGITVTVKGRLL